MNTKPDVDILSEREWEVMTYLAQCMSYKEIAARLYLSVETIRSHIQNIYSKWNVHKNTEAIVKYMNVYKKAA